MDPIEADWLSKRCQCDHLRGMHYLEFGECFECECENYEENRAYKPY